MKSFFNMVNFSKGKLTSTNSVFSLAKKQFSIFLMVLVFLGAVAAPAFSQDYSITAFGAVLTITDVSGNGETMTVSQSGTNIRFVVTGRTYSINGGPVIAYNTTPADISLAGKALITINAMAGNDVVNMGGFTSSFPSLIVNGGTGNDNINFTGNITFGLNYILNVNLQNDDATPGTDNISVNNGADLILSGTGIAELRCSRSINFSSNSILRTVNGNLILDANQQAISSTGNFSGVYLFDNALVESIGSGQVTVSGTGGNSIVNSQHGVYINAGSILKGGNSGTLTITGTGGESSANANSGVIAANNAQITTAGANILINGFGKGLAPSEGNYGVYILSNSTVLAGGSGTVTINGTGGNTSGNNNTGVWITSNAPGVTSSGGNVTITGIGGGTGSSGNNSGVLLRTGGIVTAGGSGMVTLNGTGGFTSGASNHGVFLDGNSSTVTSSGGNVLVTGVGGGVGISPGNVGVLVNNNAIASGGPGATVSFHGTGGGAASDQPGVQIINASTTCTGNISITAASEGTQALLLSGTGTIATTGASQSIILVANSMSFAATAAISTLATGTVTLRQQTNGHSINLGGADVANTTLGLTDAELNRILSPTPIVTIGSANTGPVTISAAITRSYSSNFRIFSSSIGPNFSGTDINTNGGTFSAGTGSNLNIDIDGTTVNTQYRQLAVNGLVDLSVASLQFTGSSYTPSGGETFTIVNNDGADAISGTFAGLAEGATIPNFLGSALSAKISYIGGTGNDVVITVNMPDYTITTTANALAITDLSGNGETLTASQNGSNIRFVAPVSRTYSINGGPATTFSAPADVALAGLTSITINAGAGSDIVNIGAFSANLPNLTINGGIGNDNINFTGNITFASNANLDVDLQDDDVTPGSDNIYFGPGSNINLTGTGSASMRASRTIYFAISSILRTVNGNMSLEANQQAMPTMGNFSGIDLKEGSVLVECLGSGSMTIKGKGGTTSSINYCRGVQLINSSIVGGATGEVEIIGTGGFSHSGDNIGVFLTTSSKITSVGANVNVIGYGGQINSHDNHGIFMRSSQISAGGFGNLNITGIGSALSSGGANSGLDIKGISTISSIGGNININGVGGGTGSSFSNLGIDLQEASSVVASGNGSITINGTGGNTTSATNFGISLNTGASISASGGLISIISASTLVSSFLMQDLANISNSNSGNISFQANSIGISSNCNISTDAFGFVSLAPLTSGIHINLGGADIANNTLGLTDAELDRILSPTPLIIIGNASSGTTTISSSITRSYNTNLRIFGNGLNPIVFGTDINTNGGTLTLGTGSNLNIGINGKNFDTQYRQLALNGLVNLNGIGLTFSGSSYWPSGSEVFTIVNNDGADPITGFFAGLPEGAIIPNFLGRPLTATISYVGGNGNDVVIRVAPVDYEVNTNSTSCTIIDWTGNGETLTVSEIGANIRFTNSNTARTYSINEAGASTFATPVNLTLAGKTSITIYAGGGNDVINIDAFAAAFPSLTINGGIGNDDINFNGNITFATNRFLNVDLQDDNINPGTDNINILAGADLILSGTGSVDLRASQSINLSSNSILRTVNGSLILEANQQAIPSTGNFAGINLNVNNAVVECTGSGTVTVKGRGGNASFENVGVHVGSGSAILGGLTGALTIQGSGGPSTSPGCYGIWVTGSNSRISSMGGSVILTGIGGGSGTVFDNSGIRISSAGLVSSGGTGSVNLIGTAGTNSTGNFNYGVIVDGLNSRVTSSGGNVSVTGVGGGSGASNRNIGVVVDDAGQITASGSGTVTVTGTGGSTTGFGNSGVVLEFTGSSITSSGGNVTVTGQGGGSGASANNYGVDLENDGEISAGGSGTLTITGTGGNTSATNNHGLVLDALLSPSITAQGNITLTAISPLSTTAFNSAGNSTISCTGAGNTIVIHANTMGIDGTIQTTATGSVTLKPTTNGNAINLGGADVANTTLGLSDLELDRIISPTPLIVIGDANSGTSTISSSITRGYNSNVRIFGNGVNPDFAGTDLNLSGETLTLGTGSNLNIDIDGTTVNTQYKQLNVNGLVNLNGVPLQFSGSSYSPSGGETFTIVNNDGVDAITGTFFGLPQGATIANFLGGSLSATISYLGGTGNDVVITVSPVNYTIITSGNNLIITDQSGNGETLTASQNGTNIRFVAPVSRTYSINGGPASTFSAPADIALAGLNSITINAGGGNDVVNISAFSTNLPNLTIHGGIGNDNINFNGNITFANNANLNVDLQNDDPIPGTDNVFLLSGVQLILAGNGAADIKASRTIGFGDNSILRTVNGNLILESNQQLVPTTGTFIGINLNVTTALVECTGFGQLQVRGKGGSTGGGNIGIRISSGSILRGGTLNVATIDGKGGAGSDPGNYGIWMLQTNSRITSYGASLNISGTGGGNGSSTQNIGILMGSGTEVSVPGVGNLIIDGTGGSSTGGGNSGISISGTGTLIATANGTLTALGQGGGLGSSAGNIGISIGIGSAILVSGSGQLDVIGKGGQTTGTGNHGIVVSGANAIISALNLNSSLYVECESGGTGGSGNNFGLLVFNGGQIKSGMGMLIAGSASSSSASNIAFNVYGTGSEISSSVGNILIRATAPMSNQAFSLGAGASLINSGVNGLITIASNTVNIDGAASISTSGSGTVHFLQLSDGNAINLGGADIANNTLGLTNAELSRVLSPTSTIIIGDANSGPLTITDGITRTYATNFTLFGNNILPNFNATDIDANGGTVTIGLSRTLQITVNGATPNTQYQQLRVNRINLNGATLSFAGSTYMPVGGETFTIVDNEGLNPISGTFASLPEGFVIPNFLGSSLSATISYVGGTGNDVVITVEVPVGNSLVWNGSQGDGNWNNPLNWTPGFATPNALSNVTIPGGVPQPNITSNVPQAVCANLNLTGNANPIIGSGFQVLVFGNITGVASSYFGGQGKVSLQGNSTQNVSGTLRLSGVDFANTAGAVTILPSALLQLEPGGIATFLPNSHLTNNGRFVLKSDATATAKIGPIPTSAVISGEFTQERYLPYGSGTGSWYFLGSPFGGKNFTEFSDNFTVTGLTSGFGMQGGNILPSSEPERSTIFKYVESMHNVRTDTVQKIGWRIPGNENVVPGMGYRMWVKYYNNTTHKFDTKGTLTRGSGIDNDVAFPTLTRNDFGNCFPSNPAVNPLNCNEEQRGWNLLANPFPCDIDWDNGAGWTKPSEMNNAFYTWNSAFGGYRAYIGLGGIDLGVTQSTNVNPNLIPSGQSFFVRLSDPGSYSSTLKVKESAKSTTNQAQFTRLAVTTNNQIRIRLTKPELTGYQFDAMIRMKEGATDGFDKNNDLQIFRGTKFEFAIKGEGSENFLLNTIAPITGTKTIPLEMRYHGNSGQFEFGFMDVESLNETTTAYLKDNYLGSLTQIHPQTVYSFQATSGASLDPSRFELIFSPNSISSSSKIFNRENILTFPNPVIDDKFTLVYYGGSTDFAMDISDLLGRAVPFTQRKINSDSFEIVLHSKLAAGQYFLKIKEKNEIKVVPVLVR